MRAGGTTTTIEFDLISSTGRKSWVQRAHHARRAHVDNDDIAVGDADLSHATATAVKS